MIQIAHPHRAAVGESPLWCHLSQSLWWVDIDGHSVQRLQGDDFRRWQLDEPVGCLALTDAGRLILGLKSGFTHFDPETGALTPLAPVEPDRPANRLNDGATSRGGRFFAASMAFPIDQPTAALHRLDGRTATTLVTGLHVGNGLAFSPDDRRMYLSDSWLGVSTIWTFDHDPATGNISNRRIFRQLDPASGRPDGGCVDAEGFYWIAAVGGGRLLRLDPHTAEVEREIALPVAFPSKMAFGGPDLRTLFVTSIDRETPSGDGGRLFRLTPGVTGLPQPTVPDPVS
ncbi:SMP-30/gluconolactonase/LRE family protein [Falsirhodobacter sp. 20TX0035]|uniref:SMP-30/gluconolactonase/LRE family protein n=1 Tax=Falsirhodobacter sp. 20TX0035 TaxID=3022019 RepID=UPI00232F4D35|nr:SMP-30/gluconolactonase/LRE family protein [Falsirhodobacter sp. 20TX0035]MDB6452879.1 SMP-30/gluconolactonase/LRE family protein [Falsirhodobacter sp. 20TX0035]